MLPQLLVTGLAIGSIYALIGLSLVLINKATDVVNFAQGELAMFSTFLSFTLLTKLGVPLLFVFILSFPVGAILGALVEVIFIQPIANDSPVNLLIVTIGLWITFNNLAGWIWGYDPYRFPSLFSDRPFEFAGAHISMNSIGIIGVALLLMGALYLFFEHTREGIAMRAASMNRRAARLMGIRVSRVWLTSWALAGGISGMAGVLVAPVTFLDFNMMVAVLLKAFAGAILGGFNSLPGAVVGGIAIGIMETMFGAFVSTTFKDNFAFVIIILVLMIRPTGLFGRTQLKKV
jgi:branched-chain amino acid transport system permease protein